MINWEDIELGVLNMYKFMFVILKIYIKMFSCYFLI